MRRSAAETVRSDRKRPPATSVSVWFPVYILEKEIRKTKDAKIPENRIETDRREDGRPALPVRRRRMTEK